MAQLLPSLLHRYDTAFAAHPLTTMMATNTFLNALADTAAQTVTSSSLRSPSPHQSTTSSKTVEKAMGNDLVPPSAATIPPPFDWNRFLRFASWGCVVAPFQFKWFQLLSKTYPVRSGAAGMAPLAKRVALDQSVFAPVGLVGFFTWMSLTEGGGWCGVRMKMENVYLAALKSNYMLWPAVQVVNFALVPLRFQLPFASSWGIAWGTYLSLANSAANARV